MQYTFEDFIQLELPRRPYLVEDVEQETVIVRRGDGPRQLGGVKLTEGQTLVMRDGRLVGGEYSAGGMPGGAVGFSHVQEEPAVIWEMPHDHESRSVVVTVLDENNEAILYDSMLVHEDRVTVTFYEPQAGRANVLFVG